MKAKIITYEKEKTKISPEIEIYIDYESNAIFIPCKCYFEYLITATWLNTIKGNLHLIYDKDKMITIHNFNFRSELDRFQKENIVISGQLMYIGSKFIDDMSELNNLKKVNIFFGNNTIISLDKAIESILKSSFSFSYNSLNFQFKSNELIISGNSFSKDDFWSLLLEIIEILWIIYGFCPPIKKIEYMQEKNIIIEYINMHYIYYTAKDHIRKENILIDLDNFSCFSDIIDKWIALKYIYKDMPFLGLIYATCDYNKFSDLQLCTLLQGIDGITQILYKDNIDVEKNNIIDGLIKQLPLLDKDGKYTEALTKYLNSGRSLSFKERLKLFSNSSYDNIMKHEEFLATQFHEKENKCKTFNKSNKLYTKFVNERNKLSHMANKNDLLEPTENKVYLYKFLLISRIQILKLLELDDYIDYKAIDENIVNINSILKNTKNHCAECKYLINNHCTLF